MSVLIDSGKQFLIIGNQNAFGYKEVFKLIKENKLWPGYNMVKQFSQPDGSLKTFGNVCWFTNMPTTKRQEEIKLSKDYKPAEYPSYDNFKAIEVDRVLNIPKDYSGIMGVPITFIDKYNPEQFEILNCSSFSDSDYYGCGPLYVGDKKKYARVLIRHR